MIKATIITSLEDYLLSVGTQVGGRTFILVLAKRNFTDLEFCLVNVVLKLKERIECWGKQYYKYPLRSKVYRLWLSNITRAIQLKTGENYE